MTKEEVLSKVRKLFELSNSPNENEAALAAAKARELLARYNLSIADLPTNDANSALAATEISGTCREGGQKLGERIAYPRCRRVRLSAHHS